MNREFIQGSRCGVRGGRPTPPSAWPARVMEEPDQGSVRGGPYCVTFVLSLLLAALAPAQEKTAIQTSGEEVLVDVVVRDKKGHAVTNLSESSFTVLDEGVPRQISSFRLVKGTDAVSAANGTTTTQKLD